jgi:transposase-like protein
MAHGQSVKIPNWTHEEATAVVARWEASGQSCRAFCATHGVEVKRLYRWRRRLRPRPAADPPPGGFVLAVASPGVRVRLAGGALIEVDPGFDGHLLRQVVAALC